jgi:hypothetical protein
LQEEISQLSAQTLEEVEALRKLIKEKKENFPAFQHFRNV